MRESDEATIRRLDIYQLRDMARDLGVKSPTTLKKNDLIDQVLAVVTGRIEPEMPRTRQGRPPKNKGKMVVSAQNLDIDKNLGNVISEEDKKFLTNGWYFCVEAENYLKDEENFEFCDGEGYVERINDRKYLFDTNNCSDPKKAILIPKAVDKKCAFRIGDFVRCLYRNPKSYDYKILYKVQNEEDFVESRPRYEEIKRVEATKPIKIFSHEVKMGDKIVVRVDSLSEYNERVQTLAREKKECFVLNLVLDSLVEDSFARVETMRTCVGDSTKKNEFLLNLVVDRVKRLVERGKNVILCINELLKIVKYQNYVLGNDYGVVRADTFIPIMNLFRLAGAYDNGATVTLYAIMKREKFNACEDVLLNELDNLNTHIYEKH